MSEPVHPRADQLVSPDAVVAPKTAGRSDLRPEHLYKTAGLLFLFALLLHYLTPVMEVVLLMYASVILAVIFNAMIRHFPVQRKWMAGLLGILILGALGALLWFGIPVLLTQLRDLTRRAPEFTSQLAEVERWVQTNTGLKIKLLGSQGREMIQELFLGGGKAGNLMARASGLLGAILIPLLVIFGGLYAVAKPNEQLLSPLLRAVPRDRRLAFRRIFQLMGDRLLGWAKGVSFSMLGVGLMSFLFYSLIGVPNAFLMAVIAGLTEAIPLVGPWIGGGIATALAFLVDPTKALWTAIAAAAVQQIEANLLMPVVMSRAVSVHPFVTLFALLLFGTLFGFLGVLLSIPLVLLIATLVEVLWIERAIDTDTDRIAPVVQE